MLTPLPLPLTPVTKPIKIYKLLEPAGGGSVINGATLSSFRYMSILTDVLAWIFLRMAKWTDTLVEILA